MKWGAPQAGGGPPKAVRRGSARRGQRPLKKEGVELTRAIEGMTTAGLYGILVHLQKLTQQAPEVAHALLAENPHLSLALLHAQFLVGGMEDPHLLPMMPDELRNAKGKAEQIQAGLDKYVPPLTRTAAKILRGAPPPPSGAGPVVGVVPPAQPLLLGPGQQPASLQPAVGFQQMPQMAVTYPGVLGPVGAVANPMQQPGLYAPPPPMHLQMQMQQQPGPSMPSRQPPFVQRQQQQQQQSLQGGVSALTTPMPAPGASQPQVSPEQRTALLAKLAQLTPEQIDKLPEQTKLQVLQVLNTSH